MHNIKVFREKCGLSQRKVADLMDVSQQAVARWENGEAKPRADVLPKLARVLGCTIDELFREPQKEAPGPAEAGREVKRIADFYQR